MASSGSVRTGLGSIVPEVLGFPIAGSSSTAHARALLLGTRIDMRNLSRFMEPDSFALSGTGAAYVFRYGVLVLFGARAQLERPSMRDNVSL